MVNSFNDVTTDPKTQNAQRTVLKATTMTDRSKTNTYMMPGTHPRYIYRQLSKLHSH